jgi:hypothetical protein
MGVGASALGAVFGVGSSLYSSNIEQKQLKAQSNAQIKQVLEQGRQIVQEQKSASSGAGYLYSPETSNFELLVSTYEEANRQAQEIKRYAKKQAKQARIGGIINAVSGTIGSASKIIGIK